MKKSQELIFKVRDQIPRAKEHPLRIMNKTTNFKAIINPETNETLTVVSSDYQLIQHQEVWDQISKLDKYKIGDAAIYKKGAVMMIELIPKGEITEELLPGTGDLVQPRVRVFNSYDASRALSVQGFGMRLICKNGAVAPGFKDHYRKAHAFKNINTDNLARAVDHAMSTWATSRKTLLLANRTKVNVEEAFKEIGKFPKKYIEEAHQQLKGKKEALLYDIWNALTNVITHTMKENVQTSTLVKYQTRINKIFNLLNDPEADPLLSDPDPETEKGEN